MPLGESMISTVKSNKSIMLDKSKRFKRVLGGYGKDKKTEYNLPEATPKVLNEIREKLRKEYKRRVVKTLMITILIITALVWILLAS